MTTPQSPQRAFNGYDDINQEFQFHSEAKYTQDGKSKFIYYYFINNVPLKLIEQ